MTTERNDRNGTGSMQICERHEIADGRASPSCGDCRLVTDGGTTADVSEHFDGVLVDDERSPTGYKELIGVTAVLVEPNTGRLVITGRPNDLHNCDRRGCGSFEHKIAEIDVERGLFEPIRNHTEVENDD